MHKRSPLLWSLQCVADAMASDSWAEALVPIVRSGLRGIEDKDFALGLYASSGPGTPFQIQAGRSSDLPLSIVPEIPRGAHDPRLHSRPVAIELEWEQFSSTFSFYPFHVPSNPYEAWALAVWPPTCDSNPDSCGTLCEFVMCSCEVIRAYLPERLSAPSQEFALTERQRNILVAVMAGFQNGELSNELALSPSTIKREIRELFQLFGVSSRRQLMASHSAQLLATRMRRQPQFFGRPV